MRMGLARDDPASVDHEDLYRIDDEIFTHHGFDTFLLVNERSVKKVILVAFA